MESPRILVLGILVLALVPATGRATSLVLTPARNLSALLPDQEFQVTVGLDDLARVQAYTLDFMFDPQLLAFVGAEQLGVQDVGSNVRLRRSFTIDPSSPGGTVGEGVRRASVLTVPSESRDPDTGEPIGDNTSDDIFVDRDANVGTGAGPGFGLFTIRFRAREPGSGLIEAGILSPEADSISRVLFQGTVTLEPPTSQQAFTIVPEPALPSLLLLGFAGLGFSRRARRGKSGRLRSRHSHRGACAANPT